MKKEKIIWISDKDSPEEQYGYDRAMLNIDKKQAKKESILRAVRVIERVTLWICAVGGLLLGIVGLLR